MTLCSLSKTDRCLGGGCRFHRHSGAKRRTLHSLWATQMEEVVRSSETWVVIYKSIRHHTPEHLNFLQGRSEKLKTRKTMPVLHYSVQVLSTNLSFYRVIHKSLRDFRTRLRNNQDRHGRKKHINR